MANLETPFQRELVKQMNKEKMHAFKASNQFQSGVPDLSITSAEGHLWTECKFFTAEPNFQKITVHMTTKQWDFLQANRKAGGRGALVIGYLQKRTGQHDVHGLFICDPSSRSSLLTREWLEDTKHAAHIRKVRGAPWPATLLVSRIHMMAAKLLPWAQEGRA